MIVITGASSGIGAALALQLARPGARMALTGRDRARLAAVAERCRATGADVEVAVLDVRDGPALEAWLQALDDATPVSLLIANAGVAAEGRDAMDGPEATRLVFDTNLGGALNTVLPLLPAFRRRASGRIVFMSSIAAWAPLPDAPAYSGSKAALLAYGLALRERLRPEGLSIHVVCPGFVRTGMAEGFRGWRPLEMNAEAAARRIVEGWERDRAVIAFPRRLVLASRLRNLVPDAAWRMGMKAFRFSLDDRGREPPKS